MSFDYIITLITHDVKNNRIKKNYKSGSHQAGGTSKNWNDFQEGFDCGQAKVS